MNDIAEEIKIKEAKESQRKTNRSISRLGIGLVLTGLLFMLIFSTNGCSGITGSGNVIEQGRELTGFDEIELEGMGEIILTQGDQEGVIIEAEDNLMEFIDTTVRGDRLSLVVGSDRNINPSRPIRFLVTVPEIERIDLHGAANVSADSLAVDSLELNIDGTGNITIDEFSGEGIESTINGLGSIFIDGDVEELKVQINGSGNFEGEDLKAEEASVEINGLGSVDVGVSDKLDVEINGSGSVTYSGSPDIDQSVNGLGRVQPRD